MLLAEPLAGRHHQLMARNPKAAVYVYVWYRPDTNEPFYVGVGVRRRGWSLLRRNEHTLSVVRKVGGIKNIRIEIRDVESWEAGLAEEKRLIAEIGRRDRRQGPLTNETDGGEGALGRTVSDKVRRAFESGRQRPKSPEARARQAERMRNRIVTDETRSRLAAAFRGKPRPSEVQEVLRENLRKAALTRSGGWIGSEANRHQLSEAQDKAKEWHRSEEGRAVHMEIGRTSWQKREWVEKKCQHCGRPFLTPYPTRAKFCHLNCKMAALRRRRGKPVRVARKVPLLPAKRRPPKPEDTQ